MASLYIKDDETAALASELARRLKTTKTAVVRAALQEKKAAMQPERSAPDLGEWLRLRRKSHPLPPLTGFKADKAFFDEMWGEEPD